MNHQWYQAMDVCIVASQVLYYALKLLYRRPWSTHAQRSVLFLVDVLSGVHSQLPVTSSGTIDVLLTVVTLLYPA